MMVDARKRDATIVLVEDEEPVRELVKNVVAQMGHNVEGFGDATSALERVQQGGVDLIIADISMPGESGFEFRDRLIADKELADIPFMFLTGSTATMSSELARRSEEVVVFKPISTPALRRIVDSMLGSIPTERGAVTPKALLDLVRRVSRQEQSVMLHLYKGEVRKTVIVRGGKLAFAVSNDPTEFLGQALVREGLVSEQGLARLFEARGGQNVPLGEVFLAQAGAHPDVLNKVLRRKIKDALLDAFLWNAGYYEVYFYEVPSSEFPFSADIELPGLIEEARKRVKVWEKVGPMLPGEGVGFELNTNGIPDGEVASPGDQILAQLVREGLALGSIVLELRGQRYSIGVRLAYWLRRGYIKPAMGYTYRQPSASVVFREMMNSDVATTTPDAFEPSLSDPHIPIPPELHSADASLLLGRALEMLDRSKDVEARPLLVEVLELEPGNVLARKRLEQLDKRGKTRAQEGFGLDEERQIILLTDKIGNVEDLNLNTNEAFVYSRLLAEPLTVEVLTQVCPLPEPEIFRILMRFATLRIVKIV